MIFRGTCKRRVNKELLTRGIPQEGAISGTKNTQPLNALQGDLEARPPITQAVVDPESGSGFSA